MPLHRSALALGPGPRSVGAARRWVVGACADIGRDDLAECAELGVSELVTNALLHAESPIAVRVRGTREHPRVEVHDSSQAPPDLPEPGQPEDADDELLLTFGRGLSIVARASDAWGVEVKEDGKIMWFAPASSFAEEMSVAGRLTGLAPHEQAEPDADEGEDLMDFSIRGVPVRAYIESSLHYAELRREIRLLALAHQDDYPLAKNLTDLFSDFERPAVSRRTREQIQEALAHAKTTVDLEIRLPRAIANRVDHFMAMLDLADAFCREERLLSLARTPEQRSFQNWFLGEFARQSQGHDPRPWRPSRSGVRENSLS